MTAFLTVAGDITQDRTTPRIEAGGTPAEALVTSLRPDVGLWRQAIDQMLGWKSASSDLGLEDRPAEDMLDTAIDYAVDQVETTMGAPAPSSIVPSGSGRVAMEWNDGSVTIIIEFVALGVASLTEFHSGKVVQRNTLRRNPTSRKLELRG